MPRILWVLQLFSMVKRLLKFGKKKSHYFGKQSHYFGTPYIQHLRQVFSPPRYHLAPENIFSLSVYCVDAKKGFVGQHVVGLIL